MRLSWPSSKACRLHAAFNDLNLQASLCTSLILHRRRKAIPTLPDEIILHIFQAVADILLEHVPWYEWWYFPPQLVAFVNAASLVNHRWNALARSFFKSTLSISSSRLLQARCWKSPPEQFFECKHLHLRRCVVGPQQSSTAAVAVLPKIVYDALTARLSSATAAANLTSFAFDIHLFNDEKLKHLLYFAASQVRRLYLYSTWAGPLQGFKWTDAFFLHRASSSIDTLVLCDLALRCTSAANGTIPPQSPCKTVILEDVTFSDPTDISLLFPKMTRLCISQSDRLTDMTGPRALDLSKTSDSLQDLEICWSGTIYPLEHYITSRRNMSASSLDKSILASPNLRKLRICAFPGTRYPDPPGQSYPFVLPGYSMPSLEELEVRLPWVGNWPSSFPHLCTQLEDPTFCPQLARLPDLRTVPSHIHHPIGFIEKLSYETERTMIAGGLAALQARGLGSYSNNVPGSIWEYAIMDTYEM